MQLTGPYLGVVVSNTDPAKLGRVKVNVPHVYGVSDNSVGITDLPWAIPAGLPAGGSAFSGGIDWVPDAGDQVLVFFLDGEPEKPVWMWLMQTLDQAQNFKLHHYSNPTATGHPDRAALTRYGHTLELNAGSAVISTKNGYQLFLLDGDPLAFDGNITLQTPRLQSFEIDDQTNSATLTVLQDCYFNIGLTWQAMCDDLDFESINGGFKFTIGSDWVAAVESDLNFTIGADAKMTVFGDYTTEVTGGMDVSVEGVLNIDVVGVINSTFAALNLGTEATEPYVLGNKLLLLFNTLLIWLAGHTHGNGNNGSPTTPPITPPQPEIMPLLNQILSATIKGQ